MSVAPAIAFPDTASFKLVELSRLKSPTLRLGADYWHLQRGSRRFPAREDIRPEELAGVLRGLAIIRVLDGGEDFEHCMVGDGIQMAYRAPGQGRRLSEVARDMPGTAGRLRRYYRHVTETRFPLGVHVAIDPGHSEVNFADAEALLLPLGVTDTAVDHILVFTEFTLHKNS
jgi:hypothetical protein